MTFYATNFIKPSLPWRTSIDNANVVVSLVTGAGTVTLSPVLPLYNTLLVPSLLYKLLYTSQVTTNLNCVVFIYSTFCLLQDILTKKIIGHDTKRGALLHR